MAKIGTDRVAQKFTKAIPLKKFLFSCWEEVIFNRKITLRVSKCKRLPCFRLRRKSCHHCLASSFLCIRWLGMEDWGERHTCLLIGECRTLRRTFEMKIFSTRTCEGRPCVIPCVIPFWELCVRICVLVLTFNIGGEKNSQLAKWSDSQLHHAWPKHSPSAEQKELHPYALAVSSPHIR